MTKNRQTYLFVQFNEETNGNGPCEACANTTAAANMLAAMTLGGAAGGQRTAASPWQPAWKSVSASSVAEFV